MFFAQFLLFFTCCIGSSFVSLCRMDFFLSFLTNKLAELHFIAQIKRLLIGVVGVLLPAELEKFQTLYCKFCLFGVALTKVFSLNGTSRALETFVFTRSF